MIHMGSAERRERWHWMCCGIFTAAMPLWTIIVLLALPMAVNWLREEDETM